MSLGYGLYDLRAEDRFPVAATGSRLVLRHTHHFGPKGSGGFPGSKAKSSLPLGDEGYKPQE
jgi:hypothetical protein